MRELTLTGRVGSDAQVKVTSKGKPYLEFRFANNEFGDAEGTTFWVRVVSYNNALINLAQYYTKGKSLIVTGSYKNNTYTDKSNNIVIGNEIVATAIYFNGVGGGGEHENSTAQTPAAEAPKPEATPAADAAPKHKAAKAAKAEVPMNSDADDLPF